MEKQFWMYSSADYKVGDVLTVRKFGDQAFNVKILEVHHHTLRGCKHSFLVERNDTDPSVGNFI